MDPTGFLPFTPNSNSSGGSSSDTPGTSYRRPQKHTKSTAEPINQNTNNTTPGMSIGIGISNGDQSDSGLDYSTDHGYTSSSNNNNGGYGGYQIPTHPSLYPAGPIGSGSVTSPSDLVGSPTSLNTPHSEFSPPPPSSTASTPAPTATSNNSSTTAANPTVAQLAAAGRRAPPSTPPVPLACTECRLRHLKCDAGVPTCGRCRSEGRTCSYIKSRRGWKGRKRKGTLNAGTTSQSEDNEGPHTPTTTTPSANTSSSLPTPITTNGTTILPGGLRSPQDTPHNPLASSLEAIRNHYKGNTKFISPHETAPPAPTANLIQLYYAYFHASHPFVLPPAYLIKTPPHMLKHLLPSMRFMGSFFAANNLQPTFRDSAEASLFRQGAPKNAWTVQALLLFAIGLHANNEQERAGQVKDVAVEMALELGMNYEEFAMTAGVSGVGGGITGSVDLSGVGAGGLPMGLEATSAIIEESWRRTWWELYFLDGLLAGIHQRDQFRLWTVECTVPLPCEEVDYNTGKVPPPCSLQEFDDRYFSPTPTSFSSFAYRVEAVRILGQVLAAQTPSPASPPSQPILDDPRSDAADASLTNWFLHLPEAKKELVAQDGKVDEMLFQAHMVIQATSIYLHRPRSHLVFSAVPDDTRCTPSTTGNNLSKPPQVQTGSKPTSFHTSKTLLAADSISRLITLPTPLIKHSPFFTCIITLSSIVHLSACSWFLYGDDGYLAKERIRLAVGALKTMETVWSVAGCVLTQVRGVASEVFRVRPPVWDGQIGGSVVTEEEVLGYMDEELVGGWDLGEVGPGGEMGMGVGMGMGMGVAVGGGGKLM